MSTERDALGLTPSQRETAELEIDLALSGEAFMARVRDNWKRNRELLQALVDKDPDQIVEIRNPLGAFMFRATAKEILANFP